MTTQSSSNAYTFSVTLPSSIQSEMITVTAMKGDRLDVVADAWHMERDCKYHLFGGSMVDYRDVLNSGSSKQAITNGKFSSHLAT